jgi:uncharacterized protein (TIGR01244 family)
LLLRKQPIKVIVLKHKFAFSIALLMLLTMALATQSQASESQVNLQQITESLYTSGELSSAQIATMKTDGLMVMIDLRNPSEGIDNAQSAAKDLNLHYSNVPVGRELPNEQTMAQISAIIDAAAPGNVLLHCTSGHRAGIVAALYLQQQGASNAQALASAEAAGTRTNGLEQLQTHFGQAANDAAMATSSQN